VNKYAGWNAAVKGVHWKIFRDISTTKQTTQSNANYQRLHLEKRRVKDAPVK